MKKTSLPESENNKPASLNHLTKSVQKAKCGARGLFSQYRGKISELAQAVQETQDKLELRDAMLETVNQAAAILLSPQIEDFSDNLRHCMAMLAEVIDVDRVYIWKNHTKDNRLCCTQVYEWSGRATPQYGSIYTVDIPYDTIPCWEKTLGSGQCINSLVRDMSPAAQAALSVQGIVSILVVPMVLQGQFCGFIGFDDCHNERVFSDIEETILRSASLLIGNALLRNEMTISLQTATAELESALEKANAASVAKSNFLSNMSHEIRTPLNAIIGMTSIGSVATDLAKKDYAFERIEGAATHLLGIINDILEMSKIEAGKFELTDVEFSLEKLLEKVINIISFPVNERRQKFTTHLDRDIPRFLVGDDQRLAQVITNLLSNAVKFTPEEGSIHLGVYLENSENNMHTLKFIVKDTGIGISQEQISRLFTSFQQAESSTSRKFGGTGLGLAISKRIVELMNGRIWIESDLGQGAGFIFTIQARGGEQAAAAEDTCVTTATADKIPETFSGCRLLLAEDVEINREIVLELLKPLQFEVDCAANGLEAVQKFTAQPEKYDLIFMDLQMPEMDGLEAACRIREFESQMGDTQTRTSLHKKVPIIAMTANVFREDIEKCFKAGMNDHVGKPLDFNVILKKLRHYVPSNP